VGLRSLAVLVAAGFGLLLAGPAAAASFAKTDLTLTMDDGVGIAATL